MHQSSHKSSVNVAPVSHKLLISYALCFGSRCLSRVFCSVACVKKVRAIGSIRAFNRKWWDKVYLRSSITHGSRYFPCFRILWKNVFWDSYADEQHVKNSWWAMIGIVYVQPKFCPSSWQSAPCNANPDGKRTRPEVVVRVGDASPRLAPGISDQPCSEMSNYHWMAATGTMQTT
jgi:hypothetical protein